MEVMLIVQQLFRKSSELHNTLILIIIISSSYVYMLLILNYTTQKQYRTFAVPNTSVSLWL